MHKPHVVQIAHWPRTVLTAVMRDIGRALQDRAHFTFVELCGDERSLDYYSAVGNYVGLDLARRPLAAIASMKRTMRTLSPDIIHVHSLQPLVWASLLRRLHTPIVYTIHNEYDYLCGSTARDAAKRTIQRLATRISRPGTVAVSENIARMAWQSGIVDCQPVVIDNAVHMLPIEELDSARTAGRARLRIADDELLLVAVGRLHPQKGFDLLLQAFAMLRPDFPTARLVIVGEGAERKALESTLQRLEIADCAVLIGYIDDPINIVAAADLFVMSSRYEGCPVAFAEALACGVPAVATRVGTAPRLLEQRYPGLLAQDISADALAEACRAALAPGVDRRAIGRELAEVVRREFSLSEFGTRYWETYVASMSRMQR